VPADVGRAHRGEIADAGQRLDIPIKIATVRDQRVAGQPALDRQVVEIGLDGLF
jgi:hypothetical protein